MQNGQKSLFKVRFSFLRWRFRGFGGQFVLKSGLRSLFRAPEVPFLVPLKWPKQGHFSHFGGTENGTSGARNKLPRLFNTNQPPKPPKRHLRNPNRTSKTDFLPFCVFLIFLPHFPLSTGQNFQIHFHQSKIHPRQKRKFFLAFKTSKPKKKHQPIDSFSFLPFSTLPIPH